MRRDDTTALSISYVSFAAALNPSIKPPLPASNPSRSKETPVLPQHKSKPQAPSNFKLKPLPFWTFEEAVALAASLGLTVNPVSLLLSLSRNKASGDAPSPSSPELRLHLPTPLR
jgi:hypothetical protein